ncbi:MAG: GGDEF domain-containing protein [Xanthomonadales bacterium]|nr:GGDEF domain-containing protein [Xanthomonadales bacterium]
MQQHRLAEIASRDPLTRAGNRRALRHALDEVAGDLARRATPVSLILLDLDHFKSINDVYGHDAGDRILVNFVEIVTTRLRDRDGIFRLGGEEFVVILPGTTLLDAERVARVLKRTFSTQLEGPGGVVSASMGVAELSREESVRQWLSRADEALYRAKQAGRDRIVKG